MTWLKRIFLFMMVNVLVVVTLSLVLNLLGIRPYLTARGIDYNALLGFCLVWGMGGAFISLALSKVMAKWMMGVQIIDPNTRDSELQELVQTVHSLAKSAGLSKMPEVGIYESADVNAFATGPTKSHSLVAVSTGLLRSMDRTSVEGVLGHEIAHIANGDMVTMTLIQGIINAFVMFLARALAFAISNALRSRDDEERSPVGNYFMQSMLVFVLEIVFMMLGTIVVAWFSRWREFRADRGGARLAGRDSMIAALKSLQRVYGSPRVVATAQTESQSFQAFKISSGSSFLKLFSTHPPLEDRIAALERMA